MFLSLLKSLESGVVRVARKKIQLCACGSGKPVAECCGA